MPSYEHEKYVQLIERLDTPPADQEEFKEWVKARAHLDFLLENTNTDEIIVYASGEYTFAHTALISNDVLETKDNKDLLDWYGDPFDSAASYVYGGGRDDVWIERGDHFSLVDKSGGILQLVFIRKLDGEEGEGVRYFELSQEYSHLADIHWREEYDAFVKYDENGDIDPIVSATYNPEKNISLVTFKRKPLEMYMATTNSSLIRRFDFTLLKREDFMGWSNNPEEYTEEHRHFFYRHKNDGNAAYTAGRQIIPLGCEREELFEKFKGFPFAKDDKLYEDFIAYDWRNDTIRNISTDPTETTNYFEMKDNSLPLELSPAFFKPDVLLKYKNDRDKYTLDDRRISCRAAWELKSYDVNEAGQVHAYICDLRNLPTQEQQYWKSFNEQPKTGISKRAIAQDFEGQFVNFINPLNDILNTMREWDRKKVPWWKLKEERLLYQVNLPLTNNRGEWGEAFMDLSKLIHEGFDIKCIRGKLDEKGIVYDKQNGSIFLLEKLFQFGDGDKRYEGLRTCQLIRTKVKGHAQGKEAKKLAIRALQTHKSFRKHFEYTCGLIVEEITKIETSFS